MQANPQDSTQLVPAFSGLGAPYWDSSARAIFCGMSRTTGRKELIRAAEDCIAHQIADVVQEMSSLTGQAPHSLYADGGATHDTYLMQRQSDFLNLPVHIPSIEEVSGQGVALLAGICLNLFDPSIFLHRSLTSYHPMLSPPQRNNYRQLWRDAVQKALSPSYLDSLS